MSYLKEEVETLEWETTGDDERERYWKTNDGKRESYWKVADNTREFL